jgi:membrane protein implicated in regulation of membrane protease activity
MSEWWQSLTLENQWFYGVAAVFTLLFLWQFIASLIGMGDHGNMDVSAHFDAADGASAHDVTDAAAGFHYISIRSVLAFFMMFFWAAALYRNNATGIALTLLYAFIWGLVGMTLVAVLVHRLAKMQETGTTRISACVGGQGSVYLDIPVGGAGEVRVLVGNTMSVVKARAAGGVALKAGTAVTVTGVVDSSTIEVKPAQD